MSKIFFNFFFKWLSLPVEGLLPTGPNLSSYLIFCLQLHAERNCQFSFAFCVKKKSQGFNHVVYRNK